jgi:PAS domain S-box-containing protein
VSRQQDALRRPGAGGPAEDDAAGPRSLDDWSVTPLGAPSAWPPGLRAAAGVVLGCPAPLALLWGDDALLLYNAAFAHLLGADHPSALGRPAADGAPELWRLLGPDVRRARAGRGPVRRQAVALPAGLFDLSCSAVEGGALVSAEAASPPPHVLDRVADAVVLLDRDWRITFVNAAAERGAGRPRGELLGRVYWEAFPGLVGTAFERHYRRAAARQVPVELTAHDAAAGRWYEVRVHPAGDAGLALFARDVSERVRHAEALRESEERLLLALDAGRMGAWRCELPGGRIEWSAREAELFGLRPEDAPGHVEGFYALVHPDDVAGVRGAVAASLEGGGDYDHEFRVVRPDGSVRWLAGRGRPLSAPDGGVVGMVGVNFDVTARKEAEAALRESEGRFRLLADTAPILIWLSDRDGRRFYFNRPWLEFTGRTFAQEVGQGWADGAHPDDRQRLLTACKAGLAGQAPFEAEYRLRRRDGEYCWMLARAVPRRGPDGFEGHIGGCVDITDRRAAEEALAAADRRKDEFIATLAHELRNPLAPIRTALETLRLTGRPDGPAGDALATAERQTRLLVRLLDDLLDVSRLTHGALALRKERVDLAEVVRGAVETSRPLIDAAGHELSVTLPAGPVLFWADPDRLGQVLSNLLNNAAENTEPGGRIALSGEREGGAVVVQVRDSGVGIAAEALPHLFELFRSGGRPRGRSHGGLGVGLGLAKRLVELHGGLLEAHSGGPGRGSELTVRLPWPGDPSGSPTPMPVRRAAPAPAVRRVLVVDDNEDAARSLATLLGLQGYEARSVYGGPAALEAARSWWPDAVLLDIGMPVLDGYEVARGLRREQGGRPLLLVALTGWGQEEDRRRSREAGFDHHLVKPAELETIQALLSSGG